MKAPEKLTYAISLLPDQEAAARIRTAVRELERHSGNDFMVEHDVPPHLTLGIFHAAQTELPRLQELFRDFAHNRAACDDSGALALDFFGADNFLDKVIFLSLGNPEQARKSNPALFELNAAQFKKGFDFAKSLSLPKRASFVALSLAQCKPYKEIERADFCGSSNTQY